MMVAEMIELREALDARGIEWEDVSNNLITRTHFTIDGVARSVIHGAGTYGGQDGLLEVMPPLDYGSNDVSEAEDVQGYVTAQDIIDAWILPFRDDLVCPDCGASLELWEVPESDYSNDYSELYVTEEWECPNCETYESIVVARVFKEDKSKRKIIIH